VTVGGDNLFVDLDLSVANLPLGSRLRIGGAGGVGSSRGLHADSSGSLTVACRRL